MRKKVVTKIGDIFCIEFDGKFKCFFQYIANDCHQLNSSVIRAFKSRYPIEYDPDINDLVNSEVAFYAHTVLKSGIDFNAWYKIGRSMNLGEEKLSQILFGCTQDIRVYSVYDVEQVNPLANWYIWHVNEAHDGIGVLSPKYQDTIEIGLVMPYHQITNRMKFGYYTSSLVEYEILKRRPLPYADSFTRIANDDCNMMTYFHYRGEKVVRQVIVLPNGNIKLSERVPKLEEFSICSQNFSEIKWQFPHFIQEEEFECIWNK